jgi:hypothetical protein
MLFPESLPQAVISRAFHAANGELGIMPADASEFLDACQADHVEVLGWELWLVDHEWNFASNGPRKAAGKWSGLIPIRGELRPGVLSGHGDRARTRAELATLELAALIEAPWLDGLRVNFTPAEA